MPSGVVVGGGGDRRLSSPAATAAEPLPDAGEVHLAVGRPRRRAVEHRLAVAARGTSGVGNDGHCASIDGANASTEGERAREPLPPNHSKPSSNADERLIAFA